MRAPEQAINRFFNILKHGMNLYDHGDDDYCTNKPLHSQPPQWQLHRIGSYP